MEELDALSKVTTEFNARSQSTSEDLLELWKAEIGKGSWMEKGEWQSIFKQKIGKGTPCIALYLVSLITLP